MLKDARSEIKFQEESAEWERNGKEGEYAQYFGFGAENKETEMNWRWGLQREPIRHAMDGGGIYIYIYTYVCVVVFSYFYINVCNIIYYLSILSHMMWYTCIYYLSLLLILEFLLFFVIVIIIILNYFII